ncbi:DUF6233 domain-containing protein [Streptomyces sp. NPDC016845]|uniref:DUF6233 domain-containing protein n=1 Tax=Streptomyces sp. NPDC016845 TaxID=3364972 RepID=UPI0037944C9D
MERARGAAARPSVPEWLIERGLQNRHSAERDEARRALVDGTDACPHCRPDTALGAEGRLVTNPVEQATWRAWHRYPASPLA